MLALTKLLGQHVEVKFDFGLVLHLTYYPGIIEELRVEEVNTLTLGEKTKPLTTDHLDELMEYLKMLEEHPVLNCDRMFFQEGFYLSQDSENTVSVRFFWGS